MKRTSKPEKALEWEDGARRELEKETIYLRERLRQRAEALAREAGRLRVTSAFVEQARRMPSGMGGRRAGESEPAALRRPAWPVRFGAYYLGDPSGPVAVCTLASEALMDALAGVSTPGVAIVGRAFTENFGVEKVVTNLVANDRLRTLILCGTESRHRVGQTLLALHANGRDGEGRVIGSEGPQPVVRGLSEEAVRIYREKMALVDLRGEENREAILARAKEAALRSPGPWAERWEPDVPCCRLEAEGPARMGGRFTPDPTGLFLIGLGPGGETIEMEHYTREGYLDYRLMGRSADAMCGAVLAQGLIGDHGHALYVGRELQKAEAALRLGLPYEQDRPLVFPAP